MLMISACIASTVCLVKFTQNKPAVEGALDVTWDFYSLSLIRYIALKHPTTIYRPLLPFPIRKIALIDLTTNREITLQQQDYL